MSGSDERSLSRRHFLTTATLGVTAAALPLTARAAAKPGPEPRAAEIRDPGAEKTYLLAFDKGQEVFAGLLAFVKAHHLVGGQVSGIGAVSDAVLGFFDRKKKDYLRIPVTEQAEVLALTGNLALKDGEPFFHIHVVLGLPDGSTRGGHLFEAHVWPTLELVLTAWPREVQRKQDTATGLYLLDP